MPSSLRSESSVNYAMNIMGDIVVDIKDLTS